MLKQGRKREAKGLAVLYFIIGLIILLIILAVIYFALAKLDYSDKLDPDTTIRPYVEQTEPEPFVETPADDEAEGEVVVWEIQKQEPPPDGWMDWVSGHTYTGTSIASTSISATGTGILGGIGIS